MVARGTSVVTFLSFFVTYGLLLISSVDANPTSSTPNKPAKLRKRTARTTAPAGAVVVSTTPASGQFSSLTDAIASLPDDGSAQTIFMEAGTYVEQIDITRTGALTVMGETEDTSSYESNVVTITFSASLGTAGSDDASGTLRVHTDNFSLYNINLQNTFGEAAENGQALALSAYGTNGGYYGCGFYSFQDTVLAEEGVQFYGSSYIEGAVDFIFGQHGFAFFQGVTIASIGAGCITADGPDSKTDGLFVINESTIQQSTSSTEDLTGLVFLGRPWTEFASVAFTSCSLSDIINPAGWSIWEVDEPNTEDVTFVEFDSTGPGASGTRASFSTKVTSTAGYTIADVLGSDYTTWVNLDYV